jgi:hypothetical protein
VELISVEDLDVVSEVDVVEVLAADTVLYTVTVDLEPVSAEDFVEVWLET